MKKTFLFMITLICFLFGFSVKILASDYEGNLGYSYSSTATNFWFVSDDGGIEHIYLHVDDFERVEMIPYSPGVYYYTYGGDLKDKEYYYSVCDSHDCKDTYDPFAKNINRDGNKNVILSTKSYEIDGWDSVATISTNAYNNSIYAIEADKYTEKLELKQSDEVTIEDSIYARLSNPTKYNQDSLGNTSVGYTYLEQIGMKNIEIGNLYDSNNYFSPNQSYSSKLTNDSAIQELKKLIIAYNSLKMNVIARVDFLNPSQELQDALNVYSSNYIVNGKINLNNSIMKQYIRDVYLYWATEYKIDGFYILDAQSYGDDFLSSLIDDLVSINKNIMIYTDSKDTSSYYVSDDIQNALFGSLSDANSTGILSGNFSEENFSKLVNAMFSGYYNDLSKYQNAGNVINNIGSLSDLDLYSKIILVSGLATSESIVYNKLRLAFLTVFTSAGIPRVIGGNEYFNTNPIPTDQVESIDNNHKVCIANTNWCYLKGYAKNIDWGYLVKNGSDLLSIMNYRMKYMYQYPSIYSMANNVGISYDKELTKSGVLHMVINYDANSIGDYEKSIILVNYSTKDNELDSISDTEYENYSSLIGKVTKNDNKTKIQRLTFYTYTEVKVNNIPTWVYIIVMVGLLFVIFGIRTICIGLLKTKRGIDYQEYSRELRQKNKKGNNKTKIKEPSIFETYLGSDPMFKKKKKNKNNASEAEVKDENNVEEKEESNQ